MEEQELTEKIIGCAMKVHSVLGPGFLQSVYAKALAHELRQAGLTQAETGLSWPARSTALTPSTIWSIGLSFKVN